MDFKDLIKQLGDRVAKLKEQVTTEEATKNAFIMPFIKELGYDVFNPFEVVPEFVADIGIKQGEKVDYAILKDSKPIILIECKWHGAKLDIHNSQLFRYFHTTKAKFGILTNGIEYRFYTDLMEANKMDEKPFFIFDITNIKDMQIDELKKFHKSYYDQDNIVNTASELKYTNELKNLIHQELNNPSSDFVKHFAKQVYPSVITAKILDQFTNLTKKSVNQYISDIITERLTTALKKEDESIEQQNIIEDKAPEDRITTTNEELEAYLIIKAIIRQHIDINRVFYRDAQSYFSVIVDDNNRKPICRLYFGNKKFIGIFDENKKEVKIELPSLNSIYEHEILLVNIVKSY